MTEPKHEVWVIESEDGYIVHPCLIREAAEREALSASGERVIRYVPAHSADAAMARWAVEVLDVWKGGDAIEFERSGVRFTLWLAVRIPSQWSSDGVMSTENQHFATASDLLAAGYVPASTLEAARAELATEREGRRHLASALGELTKWITSNGRIENHGHRCPESACAECKVLNDAIDVFNRNQRPTPAEAPSAEEPAPVVEAEGRVAHEPPVWGVIPGDGDGWWCVDTLDEDVAGVGPFATKEQAHTECDLLNHVAVTHEQAWENVGLTVTRDATTVGLLRRYIQQQEAQQEQSEREAVELLSRMRIAVRKLTETRAEDVAQASLEELVNMAEVECEVEYEQRQAVEREAVDLRKELKTAQREACRMHYLGNLIRQRDSAEQSELNALMRKYPPNVVAATVADTDSCIASAWKELARANGHAFIDAHRELDETQAKLAKTEQALASLDNAAERRMLADLTAERDELKARLSEAERKAQRFSRCADALEEAACGREIPCVVSEQPGIHECRLDSLCLGCRLRDRVSEAERKLERLTQRGWYLLTVFGYNKTDAYPDQQHGALGALRGALEPAAAQEPTGGEPAKPAQQGDQKPANCGNCHECAPETAFGGRMLVCPVCGNKRCPKAAHHILACTGSNEPGQIGSVEKPAQAEQKDSRAASAPATEDALLTAVAPGVETTGHLTTNPAGERGDFRVGQRVKHYSRGHGVITATPSKLLKNSVDNADVLFDDGKEREVWLTHLEPADPAQPQPQGDRLRADIVEALRSVGKHKGPDVYTGAEVIAIVARELEKRNP